MVLLQQFQFLVSLIKKGGVEVRFQFLCGWGFFYGVLLCLLSVW